MKEAYSKFFCPRSLNLQNRRLLKTAISRTEIMRITLLFWGLLLLAACSPKQKADTLLVNGNIYTLNEAFTRQEAMAVKDGKILTTGADEALKNAFEADTVINLKQKAVYPGFHDAHSHFYGYATNLRKAALRGTQSFEEIIRILKAHRKQYDTHWILGRGWDQNDWAGKSYPDKQTLDQAFPDQPVYLTRIDGHAAIVNSKALEIAGVTRKTAIEGGKFLKKEGQLTGVLIDNAMSAVRRHIAQPDRQMTQRLLAKAAGNMHEVGITALSDAGLTRSQIALLDTLQQRDSINLRIDAWVADDSASIAYFLDRGVYETDMLRVGTIKLFADGALGSRGARLLKPYTDAPDHKGLWVTPESHLRNICKKAYAHNFQVATHAIGDAANRRMLKVYGEFLKPGNDRRWRIEHAQIIHPKDFQQFGRLQVIPSIQTTHATSDMYWADERLGKERLKGAYAYQKLLQQNGWLPNGSDFPVEQINPLFGFYAAVARRDQEGWPEQGFQTKNKLSREQALRAMTIWAAKASFAENSRGSLQKGKVADFVILDKDLMKAPQDELFNIDVLQTWIAGKRVY